MIRVELWVVLNFFINGFLILFVVCFVKMSKESNMIYV